MFFALGAASSALDALKALTSSKSSAQTTGASQNATSPFDLMSSGSSASVGSGSGSGGGGSQISPETMSALLDAQSQSSAGSTTASKSRHAALKDLFGQIDGDGDGKISKSEFEEALGAGGTNLTQADSVFGKLDKDGDGSVSLKELASALKGGKHHQDRDEAGGGAGFDSSSQALQGATTTSVTNSDGSVTTSLTYADGSKVTMTSAASGSSSASATSSYNFIEQMIQRQAQAISSAATSSLSVSA
jgi:Ca2+-binding EF-hand superfamily protein